MGWPVPVNVSIKTFPFVVIGVSWLLHFKAHLDVVVAYGVARLCPNLFAETPEWIVNFVAQRTAVNFVLARLEVFDSYVCRSPPSTRAPLVDCDENADIVGVQLSAPQAEA